MRAGLSHRGFGPAPVRSENLRFSSSRQSPIFDRHGRGATFVAVGSSRPNSARRVATPPWTDSNGLRHSRFNCRCPRRGVAWPRHQGTVYLRPTSPGLVPAEACICDNGRPRQKNMVSKPSPATGTSRVPIRVGFLPTLLACASAGGRKPRTP